MDLLKVVKSLCTPAKVYFAISLVSILLLVVQNLGNSNHYCVGNFECKVTNTVSIFVMKSLYVLFWTFLLQKLCDYKYTKVAWAILMLPLLLFAAMIVFMVLGLTVGELHKLL